jgi:type VI secretion system protein ImpF
MGERKTDVRTPLFDRLVDRDPRLRREVRPLRTLDRRGLRESVCRELERLFNTRCPIPAHRLAGRPRTVLDYGIPDLSGFSPRSEEDRGRLADILRRAVEAYEPRLAGVRVRLDPAPGDDLALSGSIHAILITDSVPEPVSFLTVLQLKEGEVQVHAGSW